MMSLKKSESLPVNLDSENRLTESKTPESEGWHFRTMPEMDDELFDKWVSLVEARTGMRIPQSRKSFLLSKLSIRMREIKSESYQQYYELVSDENRGLVEWETLVDRLTVHETRFWRDDSIFGLIEKEYIEKNRLLANRELNLQVWSVGCATGEEPYSLALWFEHYCRLNSVDNKQGIHATDISRDALTTARNGIYPDNRLTNLPGEYLKHYFTEVGDNRFRINKQLKQRVCFTKLNLLNMETFPYSEFDIIVCQNVMIYFDQALRIKILNQFAEYLKTGGILILGAGEVLGWNHPKMESVSFQSTLAFRRVYE